MRKRYFDSVNCLRVRKHAAELKPERLGRLLAVLQGADAAPTTNEATTAVSVAKKELDDLLSSWAKIRKKDLAELNLN